jgi:hypothetical protein
MAENFNLIFGSNAPDSTTWSDADYQTGWSTVGSTPPTAEQFDFLQHRADLKAKELKDTLDPLVTKATEEGRQPSTPYALGDTATADGLPTAWFLECTTAGTTNAGAITIPSPLTEGDTISDGTAVWTVRKCFPTSGGALTGTSLTWNGNDLGDNAIVADSFLGGVRGYIKRKSGEILQWGNTSGINVGNTLDVTFPISFTSEASFGLGFGPSSGTSNQSYTIDNVTRIGFKVTADLYIPNGVKWIAIGH